MPRQERPLSGADDVLKGFADGLRELRRMAGAPPYRELGRRAHYSAGTLSDAAAGRRLPSLAVTLAYVRACGGDEGEWERRWQEANAALAALGSAEPPGGDDCPYVGLAAFGPEDSELFFGREALVDLVAMRVLKQRVVGVFGASGAGKSSLVRAGVVPRLRAGNPDWPVVICTPDVDPLRRCADQLAVVLGRDPEQVHARLTADRDGLHRVVLDALAERPDAELLLVVDQFEEVFTLCDDPLERTRFIDAVVTAAEADGSRCRVLLGVRADFYGHCTSHASLVEALRDGQVAVGPMSAGELREAITRPAQLAGCAVEGALVAELVAHTHDRAGVLPLLSHALRETWRRRRGNTLTLVGFQATGGIDGALARTAESLYEQLRPHQQELLRNLLLRLTTPGEGIEDTKRRLSRADLDLDDPDTALVLDRLVAQRLLTVHEDGVEITHEALIRSWPRLREWLADDREGRRVHRRLAESADGWDELGREEAALLRGTRLAVARQWAESASVPLTAREREFLDASTALEERESVAARRRTARLRRLVAVLTALLLVAVVATAYAVNAGNRANEQRNLALSQKVAGEAAAMRAANPALAAQLSLAAYRLAPTLEARSGVLSAIATPHATRLLGHAGNVENAVYRPDGELVASSGEDRTVRLWEVTGRHPRQVAVLGGYADNLRGLAFRPDGRILATTGNDSTARLWDVSVPERPQEVAVAAGHTGLVLSVAFTPDGRYLATGAEDNTARLWDLADPAHPRLVATLTGHTSTVDAVAFGRDGAVLATGSSDGTVLLWDVAEPGRHRLLGTPITHADDIRKVTFSPDGLLLATAGNDNATRLWDVTDPAHPRALATLTHANQASAAGFNSDGRVLATGGVDNNVQLWDVADPARPRELGVLTGHTNAVFAVSFSPDGRTLLSGSWDRTARLWDLSGLPLTGHTGPVHAGAFLPDGRTAVTAGSDGTVRLWGRDGSVDAEQVAVLEGHVRPVREVAVGPGGLLASAGNDNAAHLWDVTDPGRGREVAVLPGGTNIAPWVDTVFAVALSRDGKTLATTDNDRLVLLRDVSDPARPRELATLTGHLKAVLGIAFNPAGRIVATAGGDNTARLWDVGDPARPVPLAVLDRHSDAVQAVVFSPDGRTLATGSGDSTVRLWDVADPRRPREIAVLTGHTDVVHAVAFSPDGRTLASGSGDSTARLWDVADPAHPTPHAVLTGHTKGVRSVAFSPDGTTALTTGGDGAARLWETGVEQAAARICGHASPVITAAEWERYFPNIAHQPPCPE